MLVKILTDQMELCVRQGQTEQANAIARELVSVAARAHMDAYVNSAAQLLDKTRA